MTMRLMTIAFGFVLFACTGSDDTTTPATGSTASAEHAADDADTSSYQSALAVATSGDAATVTAAFTPAGCATSAAAGLKTTYTFASCTGPYGLVKVSGAIEVDVGATSHITSTGLAVNSATLNLDLDVTEKANSVTIATNSTATGSRGGVLTMSGSYTATFDQTAQCVSLDGSWSTKFDDLTWSTSATAYQRCASKCPAAGGKVTFAGPAGRTLSIAYDGTASAEVTDTKGASTSVPLACD